MHDGHGAIRLRGVQAQGRIERLERQCELQHPDDLTGLVARMTDEDESHWLTRARRERHTLRDVGLTTVQDQACPLGLGAGEPLAAILGLGRCPDEQVGVDRRHVGQVRNASSSSSKIWFVSSMSWPRTEGVCASTSSV